MPAPVVTAVWGQESWSSTLIEALSLESALLRAGANRVLTDGRVVHVPRLLVNPDADWVGELQELPSDAGDADTLALVPRKLGGIATLSRESIEDAAVDELNAIGQAMVQGRRHQGRRSRVLQCRGDRGSAGRTAVRHAAGWRHVRRCRWHPGRDRKHRRLWRRGRQHLRESSRPDHAAQRTCRPRRPVLAPAGRPGVGGRADRRRDALSNGRARRRDGGCRRVPVHRACRPPRRPCRFLDRCRIFGRWRCVSLHDARRLGRE